jgi:hypothetical protein
MLSLYRKKTDFCGIGSSPFGNISIYPFHDSDFISQI